MQVSTKRIGALRAEVFRRLRLVQPSVVDEELETLSFVSEADRLRWEDAELTRLQQHVLALRRLGMSQYEIGRRLHVNVVDLSSIEHRALRLVEARARRIKGSSAPVGLRLDVDAARPARRQIPQGWRPSKASDRAWATEPRWSPRHVIRAQPKACSRPAGASRPQSNATARMGVSARRSTEAF